MRIILAFVLLATAAPSAAKDDLGVFAQWAAFRDPGVPRCYAIALSQKSPGRFTGFADVSTWPRQGVRGQVHFRLSRELAEDPGITLSVGGARFELTGGGVDAWPADKRADAAIVAAMRSATSMTVSARGKSGGRFSDRYALDGAATAMDAATVGCARLR